MRDETLLEYLNPVKTRARASSFSGRVPEMETGAIEVFMVSPLAVPDGARQH